MKVFKKSWEAMNPRGAMHVLVRHCIVLNVYKDLSFNSLYRKKRY